VLASGGRVGVLRGAEEMPFAAARAAVVTPRGFHWEQVFQATRAQE
jgi:hypothetical protein